MAAFFVHKKFPAQGMLQGKNSRRKNFDRETRMNTSDLQSGRELAGN